MIVTRGLKKARIALEEFKGEKVYAIESRIIDNCVVIECLDFVNHETQGYLVSENGSPVGRWAIVETIIEIGQAAHELKGGQ